jgi:hypothetical protein
MKNESSKQAPKKALRKTDVRRSALSWWQGLFYTQRVKEVVMTFGCDNGIIGILTDADIELLYVNRSK